MNFDVKFSESNQTFRTEFAEPDNSIGMEMNAVVIHGATFYPSVSADGTLTWTNDKGLNNPAPVNIKGEPGMDGSNGKDGINGTDGRDGKDGANGKDGTDGKNGTDGVSAKHSWSGTTLTITSASGTSSADLKGEPGQPGANGADGKDGQDGYSPVKGKDYFTEADKAEMVAAVRSQLVAEQWTFTLTDDTTVTKDVYVE